MQVEVVAVDLARRYDRLHSRIFMARKLWQALATPHNRLLQAALLSCLVSLTAQPRGKHRNQAMPSNRIQHQSPHYITFFRRTRVAVSLPALNLNHLKRS